MPTSTTPSGQNALISLLTAAEMQVLSGTPITRKEWLNLEQLTVRWQDLALLARSDMTLPGSVLLDVIQNLSLHLPNLRRALRALLSRSEVVRNGSSDRTLQLMRDACSERQPGKRKARPTLTLLGALFENYNATSEQVMKIQPPPEPWDAIDGAFTKPFTPMLLVSFQTLLAPPDDAEFEPLDEGGQLRFLTACGWHLKRAQRTNANLRGRVSNFVTVLQTLDTCARTYPPAHPEVLATALWEIVRTMKLDHNAEILKSLIADPLRHELLRTRITAMHPLKLSFEDALAHSQASGETVFWTWWPWADLSQAAEYAHAAQHASWAGAPGPALMRPIGDAPDEETLRILTRAVRHFPSVWLADRLNDLTDGTLKQLSQDALPITRLACLSLRLRQRLADQVQFWDALCQHLLDNHLLDNHLLDNHLLDNHTSHTLTGMPVPDPLLGPRK